MISPAQALAGIEDGRVTFDTDLVETAPIVCIEEIWFPINATEEDKKLTYPDIDHLWDNDPNELARIVTRNANVQPADVQQYISTVL